MKYYAVTDDPNELMHFGIKGMKWGVIRTPEQLGHHKKPAKPKSTKTKPKSPAYMRASAKLSAAMKNGIAKAQKRWDVYNSPENKQIRTEKREINKQIRNYKRGEKLFEKHVQLARQGRLKYKGISDDEVQRITDRLMLENRARIQSGNEKQSFVRRVRESASEGFVRGVGQGMSGYVSERMTARGKTIGKIKDEKRMAAFHNSLSGRLTAHKEHMADKRDAEAQQRREIAKLKIKNEYEDARNRQSAEDNYEALVVANREMGYDRVYGDNNGFGYKIGRSTRRLSDAELKARISNLEDTKKLYSTSQDSSIKAKHGTVTREYEDENGKKVKETYSNGSVAELYGPIVQAKQHARTAKRSSSPLGSPTSNSSSVVSAEDRRQQKRDEREALRQRRDEEKARARENAYQLSEARKKIADEQRYAKRTEQYEREQQRKQKKEESRQLRSQARQEETERRRQAQIPEKSSASRRRKKQGNSRR